MPPARPAALSLAALLLLWPTAAQAQAQQPPAKRIEIPPAGTDLLRAFLDHKGVKPVKFQELNGLRNLNGVIVIVIGTPHATGRRGGNAVLDPIGYARWAVQSGEAALVATDTQTPVASATWRDANFDFVSGSVEVGFGRVHCPDDRATLKGNDWCPFVEPLPNHRHAPAATDPEAKLFRGLTRVATNLPSPLQVSRFGAEFQFALAGYPEGSIVTDDEEQGRWRLPGNAIFAVGGHGPDTNNQSDYRFLALGDQSVFSNDMLIDLSAQNLEFAYRTIEFLRGPEQRSRCLFIENGYVVDQFDGLRQAFAPPKPPLPIPNLSGMQDKLIDLGNAMLSDLQDRNILNNLLTRGFGLPAIVRGLLIVGMIYATWFLMKKLFSARKPTDIPQPPAVAGVPAGPPGVFDRRQKELIRRNNVYEPVRDLVREFFVSVGVHGQPGPKHPTLVISDAVRRPESLRAALKDFWKLAYGPPQEVTVNRWRELEPYFDRLRQAHADGKWSFAGGDPA